MATKLQQAGERYLVIPLSDLDQLNYPEKVIAYLELKRSQLTGDEVRRDYLIGHGIREDHLGDYLMAARRVMERRR